MKRFVLISLVIIALVLIVSGLIVRQYLHSSRVAQQVTQRLETIYGGPVRVGEVDVGLNSTTIAGLTLYEESAEDEPTHGLQEGLPHDRGPQEYFQGTRRRVVARSVPLFLLHHQ